MQNENSLGKLLNAIAGESRIIGLYIIPSFDGMWIYGYIAFLHFTSWLHNSFQCERLTPRNLHNIFMYLLLLLKYLDLLQLMLRLITGREIVQAVVVEP